MSAALKLVPPPDAPAIRESADALAREIIMRRDQNLARAHTVTPRYVPRASAMHECGRAMQLEIKHWQRLPVFDAHTMARLQRGSDLENLVIMPTLHRLGFSAIHQQIALEIKDAAGRLICTGHIDGRILWGEAAPPFDAKSMNPNSYARLHDAASLLRMKFFRKWVWQILLYAHAVNEPFGLLIVDDCLGHWKVIPVLVEDHRELLDGLLARCAAVVAANADGTELPYHDDPAVCRECWLYRDGICTPPMDFSAAGIKPLDDSLLEEMLNRIDEIGDVGPEFASLDRKATERAKARGPGRYLVGQHVVSVTEKERKSYNVPDAVKQQYATIGTATFVDWEKLPDENK